MKKFINIDSLIHSIKTAIACLIGFFVTKLLNFPSDVWIVVTIIVVMCAQLYVGSVMQKAYLRFLGTVLGCLFAAGVIVSIGVTNVSIALTVLFMGLFFGYMATLQENLSYTAQLGAVTTSVIMLNGGHPSLLLAFERFIEITVGIVIATLVSQFILPINARAHLRRAQAKTLTQLRDYYKTWLMQNESVNRQDYYEMDETIVKSLSKQRTLAKESAHEPLGLNFNAERFLRCLYAEKEILRAITFMRIALHASTQMHTLLTLESFNKFNTEILVSFNRIIRVIEANTHFKEKMILPTLENIQTDLKTGNYPLLTTHTIDVDGFLFAAAILLQSLHKLVVLYQPVENR